MTDTFSGPAAQNIDNAKAQALSAVAQSGSAGKAALDQAAQANAASKTNALKDVMAYAALRGAPQGNVTAGQGMVSAPFDDRAATLAGLSANYGANNQAMQAANTGFFAGAKAGLPAVKGMLDQRVAGLQQASAMKQAALNSQLLARQNANDLSALRLQLAQEKLSAAQNKTQTPGQFITALGGRDSAGDALNGATANAYNAQPGFGAPDPGSQGGTMALPPEMTPFSGKDLLGPTIEGPGVLSGTPLDKSTAIGLMNDATQRDTSGQNALNAADKRAATGVDPNAVHAGVASATNYQGSTKSPTFSEWWGGFVKANPNIDPATLTQIRDNTRPMFP